MNRFQCTILDKTPKIRFDSLSYLGEIIIDDFKETFLMISDYWQYEDYEKQWKEGLKRTLRGDKKSCLIYNIQDPKKWLCLQWWILYREGDQVIIHDHRLYNERNDIPFDKNTCYSYIDDRISVTEEGHKISEFPTTVQAVREFYEKTYGECVEEQ